VVEIRRGHKAEIMSRIMIKSRSNYFASSSSN
jgi:hypothetical protein